MNLQVGGARVVECGTNRFDNMPDYERATRNKTEPSELDTCGPQALAIVQQWPYAGTESVTRVSVTSCAQAPFPRGDKRWREGRGRPFPTSSYPPALLQKGASARRPG